MGVLVFFLKWDLELMLLTAMKSCHPDLIKTDSSTQSLTLNKLTM